MHALSPIRAEPGCLEPCAGGGGRLSAAVPQSAESRPLTRRSAGAPRPRSSCSSAPRAATGKPVWGIDETEVKGRKVAGQGADPHRQAVLQSRPFRARSVALALAAATPRSWSWRRWPGISPRCSAARCAISFPITTSMSPSGRTRASCRAPTALSTSTTTSTTSLSFFSFFQGNVHVMAVCQPTVPVFAAVVADGGRRTILRCPAR